MTSPGVEHTAALCVPPEHPCLAGHFPGRPIVPGVVLLDAVLQEAQRWLGRPLRVDALPQAKFIAPLRPGEHAVIHLRLSGQTLRFSLARAASAQDSRRPAATMPASVPRGAVSGSVMSTERNTAAGTAATTLIAQGVFHIQPASDNAAHEAAPLSTDGTPA